ncbi:hypothetical protein Anas_04843 [Armadillidium nasatum]|uniref:GST C-terminal domain-containing protein n=1 Tax=Armadillidium nasatum TaxID=96803 RepID=A0A5N5SVE5_9CRUS|nr:hypothetical protein Anas_04843 [Armadillidium nasatum]
MILFIQKTSKLVPRSIGFSILTWELFTKDSRTTWYVLLGTSKEFLKGHDFAVGNKLTVADYVLIASVETFIESGINISKYPSIRKWVYRCRSQMKGYERENAKGAKRFGSWVRAKLS